MAGLRQTLQIMGEAIRQGAVNPFVRQTAARLVQNCDEYNQIQEAQSLLRFVQNEVRYTADIRDEETLHAPEFILENRYGDCDDKVILFNALCESVGIKTCIFAVGSGKIPTHVMAGVFINGQWLFAETCNVPFEGSTVSPPLGWRPSIGTLIIQEY